MFHLRVMSACGLVGSVVNDRTRIDEGDKAHAEDLGGP